MVKTIRFANGPTHGRTGELSSQTCCKVLLLMTIDFSSDYDTMIVDIQSAGGGSGWWRFISTNVRVTCTSCSDI